MSDVVVAHAYDSLRLCRQLQTYMEGDYPERVSLQALAARGEEIREKILNASPEKLLSYVEELNVDLQIVFGIQRTVAERWKSQKIDEGVLSDLDQVRSK